MIPTRVIELTKEQIQDLQPLFDEIAISHSQTHSGKERRGALLGQCWSPDDSDDKAGCAKFYLLTTEQYGIINAAIIEAMKLAGFDTTR